MGEGEPFDKWEKQGIKQHHYENWRFEIMEGKASVSKKNLRSIALPHRSSRLLGMKL